MEYKREGDRALDRIVAHMRGQVYAPPLKATRAGRGGAQRTLIAAAMVVAVLGLAVGAYFLGHAPQGDVSSQQEPERSRSVGQQAAERQQDVTQAPTYRGPADVTPRRPAPTEVPVATTIELPASTFSRGTNVAAGACIAEPDVIANDRPCALRANAAEFDFTAVAAGRYQLQVEYAALEPRPVLISVNGVLLTDNALALTTGGWTHEHQRWTTVGTVTLVAGSNRLRIERDSVLPHIRSIRFVPLR
jgi:hypothetical protein